MLWEGRGERGWVRVGYDGEDCVQSNKKKFVFSYFLCTAACLNTENARSYTFVRKIEVNPFPLSKH